MSLRGINFGKLPPQSVTVHEIHREPLLEVLEKRECRGRTRDGRRTQAWTERGLRRDGARWLQSLCVVLPYSRQ